MKPDPAPESVARFLAENPEVERLRIDVEHRTAEVGFKEVIPAQADLEKIADSLERELPDSESAMHSEAEVHSPQMDDGGSFRHRHCGPEVIEFIRRGSPASERIVWHHFLVPRWQNRPFRTEEGPDYRRMLWLSGLCGLTALIGHLAGRWQFPPWLCGIAFAVSYACGGRYASKEVFRGLRQGKIDVHFLMIVVAIGALFVNAQSEGATLLFLFSLSGGLEQFAQDRTQKTISALLKAAPKKVLRRKDGAWVESAIENVMIGDSVLVKAGELFPVDGIVEEGATFADESALTGESFPIAKHPGDPVSGGTLNLEGQAVIRVERLPQESAVQRIVTLIKTAQQQKAPAQLFTDRFSLYYTWLVLALSAGLFAVLISLHRPVAEAFYRTMTLLVVASPCALVLSIPSAILVAIAVGARRGILFRGGVAVQNLAGVNQFAFDKTGTLTKGNLGVARVLAMNGATEEDVLRIAASLGQFSTHPLSRAIVDAASGRHLKLDLAVDFQNIPGLGLEARIGPETVLVGSRSLLASRGIVFAAHDDHSHVEVWVAGTVPLGVIYLSDEIRPEARPVISELLRGGMKVTLLTGDRAAVANEIALALGIQDVRAGLSPAAKLECVHHWQAEGRKVAMVGDGINDAPSLTAANVAIGMGARGSDAALEQADVILMHDKIENVGEAVALSRRARTIIQQNLIISLGVVVVLVVSALTNHIGLSLGVVGHEGSTVLVLLNGLRLLRFGHDHRY